MAIATIEGPSYEYNLYSEPQPSLILSHAPVLSTPDHENFTAPSFENGEPLEVKSSGEEIDEYICKKYEIQRTAEKLQKGGWKRIALQFPDNMLDDVWLVVSNLKKELRRNETLCKEVNINKDNDGSNREILITQNGTETASLLNFLINEILDENVKNYDDSCLEKYASKASNSELKGEDLGIEYLTNSKGKGSTTLRSNFKDLGNGGLETDFNMSAIKNQASTNDEIITTVPKPTFNDLGDGGLETDITNLSISDSVVNVTNCHDADEDKIKFYILADTSYGSCCVDEIAAEHIDAQVIIHYGPSCLSPNSRLPVLFVYTSPRVDIDSIIQSFEQVFNGENPKVILMADITCHCHVKSIQMRLEKRGFTNLIVPEVMHDPASQIPNRSISTKINLEEYSLFHISEPPPALLLTLSSRVKDMYICPTLPTSPSKESVKATTANLFRRRYGLLNSLNACSTYGILINTLSVANHLQALDKIQALIKAAGKKYYTFVVGKINAAKMANFSEVGGWVVIGCWESSLLDCKDFYRPVITPWELEWVLTSENVRTWTGEWRGDFMGIGVNINDINDDLITSEDEREKFNLNGTDQFNSGTSIDSDSNSESEVESEPPLFDLRTGRYVSHTRPMQNAKVKKSRSISQNLNSSKTLSQRHKGFLTTIGGEVSTGAEFLHSNRTWTGLGSDFQENDDVNLEMEKGKSGVARGYSIDGKII
ncbi:2-histidine synthase subunit 2 [Erysiphe neolycopersici]|uniref:2-(3-amino-3-carboxypropyl)histidine synthase subunit 2 n=1 Tax=Erysiphe neolycopersici TaxID=212602 RepID=A0A420HVT3_9PEZI|nr:2-histidine synthase subunit 2 [Erysiphe neolycopersici]